MIDFVAGVNLPVFRGAWGHDLAPNERHLDWGFEFDPMLGFRTLAMCRVLGTRAVRIWLCEEGEGVLTDGAGRPTGVMPELTAAIEALQEGARLGGMKLYWSLLDANAWQHSRCALTRLVAAQAGEATRFAEAVAAPLAEVMDPEVTWAIEVFNEPEVLSTEVDESGGGLPWERLCDAIRDVREVLHEVRPGVAVTAGTQPIFLPGLLRDGAGDGCPVDAIDLHVYHPSGGLPARDELPVDIGDLRLWAGECGTSHEGEPGRSDYLVNYLYNARRLGYDAAFLWKLEGDGHLVRWRRYEERDTEGWELLPLGERVQRLLTVDWRS